MNTVDFNKTRTRIKQRAVKQDDGQVTRRWPFRHSRVRLCLCVGGWGDGGDGGGGGGGQEGDILGSNAPPTPC